MTGNATWEDELATAERDAAVSESMVRQAVRWLSGRHRLGSGARVLDVGSGPGSGTVLLAEEFPASEVIAVDPTAGFVERAAVRFAEHGLGERVRSESSAIGDSSLTALAPADLVWCAHVVHHLPGRGATRTVHFARSGLGCAGHRGRRLVGTVPARWVQGGESQFCEQAGSGAE
ncbi:class I SAM-dependent methyltransferase [Amycolatopsis lurida]